MARRFALALGIIVVGALALRVVYTVTVTVLSEPCSPYGSTGRRSIPVTVVP